MALTVTKRHMYDDVTLFASTDAEAAHWRLDVGTGEASWRRVPAVLMDSHLNWKTIDVSKWDELRLGDETAIKAAFPKATSGVPVGLPIAVMWDVSAWVYGTRDRRLRFIDPREVTYEFRHDWRQRELTLG